MTLDDAIKIYTDKAKESREQADRLYKYQEKKVNVLKDRCPGISIDYTIINKCKDSAEEYGQLVDWLSELKVLRERMNCKDIQDVCHDCSLCFADYWTEDDNEQKKKTQKKRSFSEMETLHNNK